ncbi:hypothetical protein BUY37_03025 [Staphylococcus cohnii]|uniref:Uncharacterized protein n=1 Tax=Staphylococcus cohnii TaxID=29382 RepID=A0A2T4LPF3_9STAP|nr:hypothetical protein BUY38_12455 [Staphylococcus cohnii]PTF20813.1 hypothetical protein BUY40_05345 [Staphylococcus cohnii]PTF22306.1 hypothetical protein BUY30_12585 [Staphylococcus cohnii]PTF23978.1 hypothetical protein BUY31_08150 [Staphylococcus cohnii]PTF34365.1 hypothetical protein BUY21_00875 [Staphylococcus cohnii]
MSERLQARAIPQASMHGQNRKILNIKRTNPLLRICPLILRMGIYVTVSFTLLSNHFVHQE